MSKRSGDVLNHLWVYYIAHIEYPPNVNVSAMKAQVVPLYFMLFSNMPSNGLSFQSSKVCVARTVSIW